MSVVSFPSSLIWLKLLIKKNNALILFTINNKGTRMMLLDVIPLSFVNFQAIQHIHLVFFFC